MSTDIRRSIPHKKALATAGNVLLSFLMLLSVAQPAFALPPLTIEDFNSAAVGETYRDDGRMRKTACSIGPAVDAGENGETVWRFFADKLPAHQIAGIIGNMQVESGVLPQRLQGTPASKITLAESLDGGQKADKKLGWGLVQWTPPGKIINSYSNPAIANDIQNQLTFLWNQLQGGFPSPEGAAGNALKATTSASQAAEVFARKYERPAESSLALSLSTRIANAEAAMVRYANIPTVASPVDPPTDGNNPTGGFATYDNSCNNTQPTSLVEAANQQLKAGGSEFFADTAITEGNSAEFVSWSLNKIGYPVASGGDAANPWLIPTVPALVDYFNNSPGYVFVYANEGKPVPGDIAYFKTGNSEYVAIVTAYDTVSETMTIVTTGGNKTIKQQVSVSTVFGDGGLQGYYRSGTAEDTEAANEGNGNTLPTPLPGGCITDGGYINNKVGECVGVQAGVQLGIYNGNTNPSVEVNLSNVTIENMIIYGCINAGSGVVIRNSKIVCYRSRDLTWGSNQCPQGTDCRGYDGAFSSGGSNNLVEKSTVLCAQNEQGDLPVNVAPCDFAFSGSGFTARYNEIKLAVDGFYPTGNNIIEYNYVHSLSNVFEEWLPIDLTDNNTDRYSHTDGVQMNASGASGIIIRGNYIVGWSAVNGLQAMLIQQPTGQPVQILNNRLEGPFDGLRITCIGGAVCEINNNTIDSAYKNGNGKAIWSNNPASTIQGNVFDDGTPVQEGNICRSQGFC